jgi:uncharacterized iron-regulated membrane protein
MSDYIDIASRGLEGLMSIFGGGSNIKPLTPEEIAQMQAGQTEYDKIRLDPTAMNAWMNALKQMQGVADEGGMDLQSRVAQRQAQAMAAQQEQMQRQAIQQAASNSQRYGGGGELAAQMMAQQGGANTAAMAGAQNASDARSRAIAAMAKSGQMAGDIRGQQFSEQAARAQSQDAINRFNASQRGNAFMANKGLGMAADRDSANRGAAIGAAAGGVLGAGEYLFGSQKKKQEPNYAGWGITP